MSFRNFRNSWTLSVLELSESKLIIYKNLNNILKEDVSKFTECTLLTFYVEMECQNVFRLSHSIKI